MQINYDEKQPSTGPNPLLQRKRQTQRRSIRRQRLQTYQRNKRKQLFKDNQRYFLPDDPLNQKQHDFITYIQSLTVNSLLIDPNNHLTYLKDIILDDKNYSWVKNKLGVITALVHQLLRKMIDDARYRLSCLKQKLNLLPDRSYYEYLENQIIQNTFIYNEVFFSPLSNIKQLCFKQTNPFNSFGQQNAEDNSEIDDLQKKKINIQLFQQFLIAVAYELTPNSFVNSLKQHHVCSSSELNFSNGYHTLTKNPTNQIMQNEPQNHLMIDIFTDFSKMFFQIYKSAHNIRYTIGTLQNLWKGLKKLYQNQLIQQESESLTPDRIYQSLASDRIELPRLWFDVQKMYVKQSTIERVSTRVLQYFVNITSQVPSNNTHFDRCIHQMCLLGEFESIVSELGMGFEEHELISQLYANLVEEQIKWSISNKDLINQRFKSHNRIQIQEQDENGKSVFPTSPGIYTELLEMMSNNWDNSQQKNQLVYIVKKILEYYDVPAKSKAFQKDEQQFAQGYKMTMYLPDVEKVSYIVGDIFQNITHDDFQSQHLSDLFIAVCHKLLPYMIHVSQLSEMLSMVIKNQNKRIQTYSMKHKRLGLSTGMVKIERQPEEKRIMTQNIKHMIKQCSEVIWVFYKETKQFSPESNHFSTAQLGQTYNQVARNFTRSILSLWEHNQLEHSYEEFVVFIQTVLETFPEYLVLVDNEPDIDQKLIFLVQEIGSECQRFNLEHQFVAIIEKIMTYLCAMDLKSKKGLNHKIQGFLVRYQDEWQRILQYLQAVLTGNKCVNNSRSELALRVNQVYEITDQMLNDSLQNALSES